MLQHKHPNITWKQPINTEEKGKLNLMIFGYLLIFYPLPQPFYPVFPNK